MRSVIVSVALVVLVACAPPFAGAAESESNEKLIVHGWGVAVVGANGVLAPAKDIIDDLPPFVLRNTRPSAPEARDKAWSGPVIHLYGPEGMKVEVDVRTPQGPPAAYWPKPGMVDRAGEPVAERQAATVDSGTGSHGLRWAGTLTKAAANEPAQVAAGHWWAKLRDAVPSMYFNAADGTSERFLFYGANAAQPPSVTAVVTSDTITLANAHDQPSGPVVILTNDGKSRHGARVGSVGPKGEVTLSRAGMTEVSWDDRETLGAFESQWRAAGMTPAEAKAITAVWRDELLNRPGFLLISRIPAEAYAQMFPLQVTPQPDEVVRAGLVIDTLVGQPEREKWLVNLDIMMPEWGRQLAAEDAAKRRAAARKFTALGELAFPFLRELAKGPDPEVAKAAVALLTSAEPASPSERKTN